MFIRNREYQKKLFVINNFSIDDKAVPAARYEFDNKLLTLMINNNIYKFSEIKNLLIQNNLNLYYDLSDYEKYYDSHIKIDYDYGYVSECRDDKFYYNIQLYAYDKNICEYVCIFSEKKDNKICIHCNKKCLHYNNNVIYDNYLCLDINYDKKLKIINSLKLIKKFLTKHKIAFDNSNISNSFYCYINSNKVRISDHNDTGIGHEYYGVNSYDFILSDNNLLKVMRQVKKLLTC